MEIDGNGSCCFRERVSSGKQRALPADVPSTFARPLQSRVWSFERESTMWRFFITVFIVGIVSWVVVDAIYWGSSDLAGLFPNRRYFVIVTVAAVVAAILWGLFWGARKFRPKRPR